MPEWTEPLFQIGDLGQLESAPGGAIILPDPAGGNMLGPSGFANGTGMLDARYTFLKDLVTGYAGRVPEFLVNHAMVGVQAVPMARQTNNIAAAQNVNSGIAMTLVSAPSQGVAINLPIIPFTGVLNSLGTATSVTTAPIVLDYGFDWAATTANSSIVTVTDSTIYQAGMPLCIPGTGASTALLTNVISAVSSTTVQVGPAPNVPSLTMTQTPVGTGNAWGPSEFASSGPNAFYPVPTAVLPYIAMGPGLFLDPRQSVTRSIEITASASTASSGSLTISGWDLYWQPITDTVTVTPTAATVAYTLKTFKAINTITPNFTDGAHTWSVGVGDTVGFPIKQDIAELATIWWNGLQATSTTGFTVPDFTATATSSTGDVRGTVQLSTAGSLAAGLGVVTNGTVSSGSLTPTGARLVIMARLSTWDQLNTKLTSPQWQMGRTPA
jgi:hypothetical protein